MPLVRASEAFTRPCRMAIQRSGSSSSKGVLSTSCGVRLQRLQVDVRLEEAVEQHQAVGARLDQPLGHVGHGELKYGPTFTASGIETDSFTAATRSRYCDSTSLAGHVRVGGDEVDVQLQGVGPGVLHQLGVADPAALARCR